MRSRTVAAELRVMREDRGLSCADVGRTLGVSASKISRIETGNSGLQVEDVAALLGFYQVPSSKRQALLDLLKRNEAKGWWERQAGLPHLWRALIDFENKAAGIQNYQPMIIPGLLQTAEYSAAMIRGTDAGLSDGELDNLVASRMARQTLLTRSTAPRFLAVIHEVALRLPVGGPTVMSRQLKQLLSLSERPNIDVRVVPIDVTSTTALRGPFMILEFAHEPDLVFVENHDTGLFLDERAELANYRLALHNILAISLPSAASAELLANLVAGERML